MRTGARLRSAACECEVIVVRAPAEDVSLCCGGAPMLGIEEERPPGAEPSRGLDTGTLLGKRYTDATGTLEVLCTRAGAGTLTLADKPLELLSARQLPSSD